eukprot:TRINITY_DN38368_c0_g1_i1.p1 TRINITY_DN38368_c0_g1~~TRINITY_DN38368_c0_g1_i1.p1  ORF type:complete len:502 (+),score=71.73 TRINITY_DN38368_c0_g1_i1:154-1659(+)
MVFRYIVLLHIASLAVGGRSVLVDTDDDDAGDEQLTTGSVNETSRVLLAQVESNPSLRAHGHVVSLAAESSSKIRQRSEAEREKNGVLQRSEIKQGEHGEAEAQSQTSRSAEGDVSALTSGTTVDTILRHCPWHYPLMCLVLITLHAHVYSRDKPSLSVALAYVVYVCIHTTSSCLQVLAGADSQNSMVTAQAIVFAALVVKLSLSSVFLAGETYTAGTSAADFRTLMVDAFRCTSVPSALYTTSDVLLVYCQQNMSLTEVQVIAKLGIPITAFIWVVIFRSPISIQKMMGLLVIMVGTSLYAVGEHNDVVTSPAQGPNLAWWSLGPLNVPHEWIFRFLLIGQVLLSTCGGVSNEYYLLRCPASVNMQNCGMYVVGLLLVCLYSRASGSPLPVRALGSFHPVHWALALMLGSTGIVTSHFLKHLGSIWKQVAYGAMLVLFFALDNVAFHKSYPSLAILGVMIVCMGNCICVLDGQKEDTRCKNTQSSAETGPKAKQAAAAA